MSNEDDSGDEAQNRPNPSELSNQETKKEITYLDIERSTKPGLSAKVGPSNSLNEFLQKEIEKKDRRIRNGNWLNYRERIKELRNRFKKCPNCGLDFKDSRKNQVYCSKKCRQMKFLEERQKILREKALKLLKEEK